jgi:hypothetical protein
MTTPTQAPNPQDDRWGGYVPWFFRYPEFSGQGNFELFFQRLSQRIKRLFQFNEAGLPNLPHFSAVLETETLQRYRHNPGIGLDDQIEKFFLPQHLKEEARIRCYGDPEYKEAAALEKRVSYLNAGALALLTPSVADDQLRMESDTAKLKEAVTRPHREARHFQALALERLGVVEALLRILPSRSAALPHLIRDIRRLFVEAGIMLDLRDTPPLIVPLEDAVLQTEVLDRLLPRLAARFPNQEKDLVRAYHDLVQGVDANTIFGNAFKALEEVARQMTGDQTFLLSEEKDLREYFPLLHSTIYATIIKLAAHRGDKGAHGRQGPPPHEMRYLLFSICNVALLFLDYPSSATPASAS